MANLNKANRKVCDVDIRILKTKLPFLFFNTANTTTAGLSGDSVYAMAKGSRKIAFPNPVTGTMTIEAQVKPFKFYALLSNGVIESNATFADRKVVTATADGTLTIPLTGGTVVSGYTFVYPKGEFGNEAARIATTSVTTAGVITAASVVANKEYEVGYIVSRTAGVNRISFNNNNIPQDYYITMTTFDKDEYGVWTEFRMTAYKASIQRTFDLSFSSEGDPASVTLTFDLLEDMDGNILDMVELDDEYTMGVSLGAISIVKGKSAQDVKISNAVGTVTATASNEKVHAIVSGDNDTVIIYADDDATAGTYTVTLTDSTTGTAQTATISVTVTNS
ncbi:MAG: hypothetical protein II453_18070 [Alphaproteobacteria bacterium]|jgi:hypothetical protein|nr:hypothetical protein [Alphaproteobacteria bacterium]